MTSNLDAAHAQELDRHDPLSHFRDRFVIAEPDLIYMLANSLGRLPKATAAHLEQVVRTQWGERLIRSWSESWIELPQRVGDKMAPLLGARPGEVLVTDSTSVNLYKLVLAALRQRPGRHKIITDDLNFPTDIYILQGALATAGEHYHLEIVPSDDGISGPEAALAAAIDAYTSLVTLTHTVFRSAYIYDMAALTRRVHDAGALVIWDLSHSAGAVPVDLTVAGVDFAAGCTYKYLNGGPGAPAFLYVRQALQEAVHNPISGWMGQDRPFDMALEYRPAPGLRRFLAGTPTILSLAAVEPAVEMLLEAGMEAVRAKSRAQTEYLIALWEAELQPLGFELRSPRAPARRGSHVAFGHPEALRISRALKEQMQVIPDFRYSDNLRLAVSPLYTSYGEIYEAVQRLRTVVRERRYEAYPPEAPAVT